MREMEELWRKASYEGRPSDAAIIKAKAEEMKLLKDKYLYDYDYDIQMPVPKQSPIPNRRLNPNDHPAYSASLAELKTLWYAKFGDRWVSIAEIEADKTPDRFWPIAAGRLKHVNALEHATDISYFRIIPDANR